MPIIKLKSHAKLDVLGEMKNEFDTSDPVVVFIPESDTTRDDLIKGLNDSNTLTGKSLEIIPFKNTLTDDEVSNYINSNKKIVFLKYLPDQQKEYDALIAQFDRVQKKAQTSSLSNSHQETMYFTKSELTQEKLDSILKNYLGQGAAPIAAISDGSTTSTGADDVKVTVTQYNEPPSASPVTDKRAINLVSVEDNASKTKTIYAVPNQLKAASHLIAYEMAGDLIKAHRKAFGTLTQMPPMRISDADPSAKLIIQMLEVYNSRLDQAEQIRITYDNTSQQYARKDEIDALRKSLDNDTSRKLFTLSQPESKSDSLILTMETPEEKTEPLTPEDPTKPSTPTI